MRTLTELTESRLRRMSLDQLSDLEGQVYDQHGEDSVQYKMVLKVMESKENLVIRAEERLKEEAEKKKAETELLRTKIQDMLSESSIRKMDAIYQVFGHEYINDYVLDTQNFIIKSLVAGDTQNDLHHLEDIDALNRKLKTLIYDRVYSRYIRNGSYGMLEHFYQEVFGRIVLMDESDKGVNHE